MLCAVPLRGAPHPLPVIDPVVHKMKCGGDTHSHLLVDHNVDRGPLQLGIREWGPVSRGEAMLVVCPHHSPDHLVAEVAHLPLLSHKLHMHRSPQCAALCVGSRRALRLRARRSINLKWGGNASSVRTKCSPAVCASSVHLGDRVLQQRVEVDGAQVAARALLLLVLLGTLLEHLGPIHLLGISQHPAVPAQDPPLLRMPPVAPGHRALRLLCLLPPVLCR